MAELIQIHDPVDSKNKPNLIFIHGLDGHIHNTWMSDSGDSSTLWPKWIGEDTGCAVWLLGYEAPTSRWTGDGMALQELSGALLDRLASESKIMAGPNILIAHSQGGLIIKYMIKQGLSHGVERQERLVANIKAAIFIGTPHSGSWLASIVAKSHLARPSPGMRDLTLHNPNLSSLHTEFQKLIHDKNIKARSYYETKPLRLKGVLGRVLPGIKIVSQSSGNPHLLGSEATGVAAHHLNICKPTDRNSAIHRSVVDFIRELRSTIPAAQENQPPVLKSEEHEAQRSGEYEDIKTHLAFDIFGDSVVSQAKYCVSVCVVTDDPNKLRSQLLNISKVIERDPLISRSIKENIGSISLEQLAENPNFRHLVQRELAEIWFSAYVYYGEATAISNLSQTQKEEHFIISPLVHRISKLGQHIVYIQGNLAHIPQYLARAKNHILKKYHRDITLPQTGKIKYDILHELASLISKASSNYLGDKENPNNIALFESLRTRIRFAQNVVTGEKHTRDRNPIP